MTAMTRAGDFFVLRDAFERGGLRVDCLDDLNGFDVLRGHRHPDRSVRFRRAVGVRPLDLVSGTETGFRLLSPRALATLSRNELTGWRRYDVEIDPAGIKGSMEGYAGISVVGRAGPIDMERAVDARRAFRPDGPLMPVRVGLHFDERTWDGTDLFMPHDGTAFILASARARAAFVAAKLTNIEFIAIREWEFVSTQRQPKAGLS